MSSRKRARNNLTYTREQKIVAAVWYHEKQYTGLTCEQIRHNFLLRFKTKLPRFETVKEWERVLFENNRLSKKSRFAIKKNCYRLAYIPYIKESFQKYPDLSANTRANMVGISSRTLSYILKHDFSPGDLEEIKKYTTKGTSDKTTVDSEECTIKSSTEIDSIESNEVITK